MRRFKLDYNIARGYSLYSEDGREIPPTLEEILYEKTLPAGEGWYKPEYQGRVSLRNFIVDSELFAVSRTIVTDQTDRVGKKGILSAEITVLDLQDFLNWLDDEFHKHSSNLSLTISVKFLQFTIPIRELFKRIVSLNFSNSIQIVLFREPTKEDDIKSEFLFLYLQKLYIEKEKFIEFSSLSLDWRDSVKFVSVPYTEIEVKEGESFLTIDTL